VPDRRPAQHRSNVRSIGTEAVNGGPSRIYGELSLTWNQVEPSPCRQGFGAAGRRPATH